MGFLHSINYLLYLCVFFDYVHFLLLFVLIHVRMVASAAQAANYSAGEVYIHSKLSFVAPSCLFFCGFLVGVCGRIYACFLSVVDTNTTLASM